MKGIKFDSGRKPSMSDYDTIKPPRDIKGMRFHSISIIVLCSSRQNNQNKNGQSLYQI